MMKMQPKYFLTGIFLAGLLLFLLVPPTPPVTETDEEGAGKKTEETADGGAAGDASTGGETGGGSETEAEEGEDTGGLPGVVALYERFIEANGGRSNIENMQTFVADGRLIRKEDGETTERGFRLYRKRPDKMRMQVRRSESDIMVETIYDGENGWRVIRRDGRVLKEEKLEGVELAEAATDSQMDGPFFRLGKTAPGKMEVVAREEFGGETVFRVEVDPAAESKYETIWVSGENKQPVRLRLRPDAAGGGKGKIIKYSEFTVVEGVWIPTLMESYQDGRRISTIDLNEVRRNVGLFDTYFQVN